MLSIRSFQLSDYSQVTSLMQDVLSDECFDETMDAFANQIAWDSELVIVAEKDGEIVGAVIGTIDQHRGYYYRVATAANQNLQEVDVALIQALKQRFDIRGIRRVVVPLDEHNQTLVPLFRSLGYEDKHFETTVHHKLAILSS